MASLPRFVARPARFLSQVAAKRRLEQMFRKHHELVWRTLRRVGMSEDEAADATQQAFLIAAERLSDIRPGCERAFVLSTAIRLGRAAYRRSRRCELLGDMDTRSSTGARADELSRKITAQKLLDQILAEMDEELITTFVLFELEGLSMIEIAQTLSVPQGTVASRLRRARAAFRARAARLECMQEFDHASSHSPKSLERPKTPASQGALTDLLPALMRRNPSEMGATK